MGRGAILAAAALLPSRPLDLRTLPEHNSPVVPEQRPVQQSGAVPDPDQPEIPGCAKGGPHLPGVRLKLPEGEHIFNLEERVDQ